MKEKLALLALLFEASVYSQCIQYSDFFDDKILRAPESTASNPWIINKGLYDGKHSTDLEDSYFMVPLISKA